MADILEAGLAKLQASEKFSDCRLICGPYQFKVHEVVLAAQSEYFEAEFAKESFKESQIGTIKFKSILETHVSEIDKSTHDACDDPEVFKLMVDYLYHLDYDIAEGTSGLSHSHAFDIALKYRVEGLQRLAIGKIVAELWPRLRLVA